MSCLRKYSLYDATIEEWTSILKLAHQWDFIEVKALAIRELENLRIPALQKIVIYQTYGVDRKYLQAAFTALAVRDEPISVEEGRELGLETALQLARAREAARAPNKRSGNPRSPVNIAGSDLDALMRDIFQLSPPEVASSTSQVVNGRRTPSGGRDSPQLGTQTNWRSSSPSASSQGGSGPLVPDSSSDTMLTSLGGSPNGPANGNTNGTTNGHVNGLTNLIGTPRTFNFNGRTTYK
jgi:hypothetical protein